MRETAARDRTDAVRTKAGPGYGISLTRTFECGQCFRWLPEPDGSYTGVAKRLAARVSADSDSLIISGGGDTLTWREYFDLDRDYAGIASDIMAASKFSPDVGKFMEEALVFGAGIRILRQDFWEALCSFIISQCNNIPRIRGIIERLCEMYGERLELEGGVRYAFPSADVIAALDDGGLSDIRCGYRAPYILAAARLVSRGDISEESLSGMTLDAARRELMKIPGAGRKVADCVLLFGLGRLDAFPVDVWMKRALTEHFGPDFDPARFGEFAGLAQQYIFHYRRALGLCGKSR